MAALTLLALLSPLLPFTDRSFNDLVIGNASAGPQKRSSHKGQTYKGQPFQKLKHGAQQLQALQQAAATQTKLQQIQTTIAAQQKHVQNVQKMVAAHKQKILQASQSPAPSQTAAQPPKHPSAGHHQALIQKALAQVKAAKHTTTKGASIAQKMKVLIAKVGASKTGSQAHHGQHHLALVKAALQHTNQHKVLTTPSNKQQTTSQVVHQHIFAKLKVQGHGSGGPHLAKHNAIFKHILAKLSAKNNQKPQTPAPAPAPAATASSSTPKKTTSVQATLPTVTQITASTTVAAAVAAAVKGNSGGDGGDANSTGSQLGSTMSKLGGPKQPSESAGSGGGSGRATYTAARDEDDDAKEGGIINALRNGGKTGRGGAARGLNPLAELPAVGTYNRKQVLAVNLSPAGLTKVLALNYKWKGSYKLPLLNVTVTKLETPAQESAVISIGKLEEAVPDSAFALNRIYVPYRLGASGSGIVPGTPLRPGSGCDANRCFGANLINWRPQIANCGQGVKVGIIDTGVDSTHPALRGLDNIKYERFVPEGSAPASRDHGTGIVSLLAGRPESSTPGLVPGAIYYVANAFYAEKNGGPAMSETNHMLDALNWLDKMGVRIINLSFAGPQDLLVHRAIKKLERKGVIVVAAAGNDGPSAPPSYPAGYEEVIAVTAVDRNLAPYRYANRGEHISIAGPGVSVWTALANRREGPQTGTSFAAPYVTGVLALSHSVIESMDDSLSPKERALRVLNANVMKLGGPQERRIFGAGLVRAPNACPSPEASAVANAAPAAAPREPVVVKASTTPSFLDWFKATTVQAATGN